MNSLLRELRRKLEIVGKDTDELYRQRKRLVEEL